MGSLGFLKYKSLHGVEQNKYDKHLKRMRIWSLHPKYLDSKGLVALWRETLLAKNVLAGKTKGYKNHPQLNRFKSCPNPLVAINQYLMEIFNEANKRGYNFNRDKIDWDSSGVIIDVTEGQMEYEQQHLLNKLKERDVIRYRQLVNLKNWLAHPLFTKVPGEIEEWEIIS